MAGYGRNIMESCYGEEKSVNNKIVRVLFIIRAVLWVIAAAATVYWIAWSFKLYEMGIYEVHEYSTRLRPILGRGLLIAFVSICISLILRSISDRIKKKNKF